MPIFLECQKQCAEIHLLFGCIEPQCSAFGVFSYLIEPLECKSPWAGQAHLINSFSSLNRGVTAEAAAILLSNFSMFCLISRMTVQVIFFGWKKSNTSVRMPNNWDVGEGITPSAYSTDAINMCCAPRCTGSKHTIAQSKILKQGMQLRFPLWWEDTWSFHTLYSNFYLIISCEIFNRKNWAYFFTSCRMFWKWQTSCGY